MRAALSQVILVVLLNSCDSPEPTEVPQAGPTSSALGQAPSPSADRPSKTDPAPLSLEQKKTVLLQSCHPSGVCSEAVLERLEKDSSEPDRRALRQVLIEHAAPVIARLEKAHEEFVRIEHASRTTASKPSSCMDHARKAWEEIDALRADLEVTALTLPAAGELREAAGYLRSCAALCDLSSRRLELCADVRKLLDEAAKDLDAGENL